MTENEKAAQELQHTLKSHKEIHAKVVAELQRARDRQAHYMRSSAGSVPDLDLQAIIDRKDEAVRHLDKAILLTQHLIGLALNNQLHDPAKG